MNSRQRLFSQEIQLSGGRDRVKWVGGVYYWNQALRSRNTRYQAEEFGDAALGLAPQLSIATAFANPICTSVQASPLLNCQQVYAGAVGGGGRFDTLNLTETNGWAAFGEATISLTQTIDLTVGLRHHDQTQTLYALDIVPGYSGPQAQNPNLNFTGNVLAGRFSTTTLPTVSSFDKDTSKLSLQKQFSKDVMGYIGYSEGFNSGGATAYVDPSTSLRNISSYKPQTLKNTEIGLRSDLANKHLRLNATLFNTIWDDIQAAGPVLDAQGHQLPNLLTTNVGAARARGAEVEMTIVPTEKILVNVNLGYLDTAVYEHPARHAVPRYQHGVCSGAEAHGKLGLPVQRKLGEGARS